MHEQCTRLSSHIIAQLSFYYILPRCLECGCSVILFEQLITINIRRTEKHTVLIAVACPEARRCRRVMIDSITAVRGSKGLQVNHSRRYQHRNTRMKFIAKNMITPSRDLHTTIFWCSVHWVDGSIIIGGNRCTRLHIAAYYLYTIFVSSIMRIGLLLSIIKLLCSSSGGTQCFIWTLYSCCFESIFIFSFRARLNNILDRVEEISRMNNTKASYTF